MFPFRKKITPDDWDSIMQAYNMAEYIVAEPWGETYKKITEGRKYGFKRDEVILVLKQIEWNLRKGEEIDYEVYVKSVIRNPLNKRQALIEVEIKLL